MAIPAETDNYIKESIEISLGLPISEKNTQLKLLALQHTRHLLQKQIFELEDRLQKAKAEANMNALGLRRSIEKKDRILSEYANLKDQHAKLEEGFKRTVEACDELERENQELYASRVDLAAQVESLKVEEQQLLVNLKRAEEEVVLLSDENKMLERNNKWLLEELKRRHRGSNTKISASASAKVKGKSSVKKSDATGRAIDAGSENARDPMTPIHFNSPELDIFNPSL